MATPITCDVHGGEHPADVLVSQLTGGDTFAACADGYIDMCRAVVAGADAKEAAASDDAALARLAGTEAPPDPTASPASSDAGDPPAASPTNAVDASQPSEPPTGATPRGRRAPEPPSEGTGDPDGTAD